MKKWIYLAILLLPAGFVSCGDDDEPQNIEDVQPAPKRLVTISSEGALPGIFSVSEDKQVKFSRGNLLKYESELKFAFFQTDHIGVQAADSSYRGSLEFFPWGGGFETGLNICDWGRYNKISNGGNREGIWRTLGRDEWEYLLSKRPNAENLKTVAIVNGVKGMILLPDSYTNKTIIPYSQTKGWSDNSYNLEQWYEIEKDGAVFLPASGSKAPSGMISGVNSFGYYWTCTGRSDGNAYSLSFSDETIYVSTTQNTYGLSIRLVQNVK